MPHTKNQFINAAAYAGYLASVTAADQAILFGVVRHDLINCLNSMLGMSRLLVQIEFPLAQVDPAWQHAAEQIIEISASLLPLVQVKSPQMDALLNAFGRGLTSAYQHGHVLLDGFTRAQVDPDWLQMARGVTDSISRAQIIIDGTTLKLSGHSADV